MMRDDDELCAGCAWYDALVVDFDEGEPDGRPDRGLCRASLPTTEPDRWVTVLPTDWCREWEQHASLADRGMDVAQLLSDRWEEAVFSRRGVVTPAPTGTTRLVVASVVGVEGDDLELLELEGGGWALRRGDLGLVL